MDVAATEISPKDSVEMDRWAIKRGRCMQRVGAGGSCKQFARNPSSGGHLCLCTCGALGWRDMFIFPRWGISQRYAQ